MRKVHTSQLFYSFSFVILLAYFIIELCFTPIVQADAIGGFISLNNALLGKGANYTYVLAESGVINKNFYTWHAPGQYFFPYILGFPFNNIGYGIILTEFILLVSGSFIYVKFFRKLKVEDDIISLSLLLIFIQRFFHGVLLVYKTADVFLFFLAPALLLLLFKYHKEKTSAYTASLFLLSIFVVNFTGLFVKNSYLLFMVFAHLFFFLSEIFRLIKSRNANFKNGIYQIMPGFLACTVMVIFYFGFYSRGTTPARAGVISQEPLLHWFNVVFYPIITVFNAPFSINGILYRLPMLAMTDFTINAFSWKGLLTGLILIIPILFVFYTIIRDKKMEPYWRIITLCVLIFYCISWSYFVFAGSNVSNEDRLVLPAVIIAMPALAYVLLRTKVIRYIVVVYVFISIIFSIAALYALRVYHKNKTVVSRGDVFKHFSVTDKNSFGQDLAKLRETRVQNYPNALLVMETHEDFFRTGLAMPVVTSYFDHYEQIEGILAKNTAMLNSEGFKHVYFVVPANKVTSGMTNKLRLVETNMKYHELYRFDL